MTRRVPSNRGVIRRRISLGCGWRALPRLLVLLLGFLAEPLAAQELESAAIKNFFSDAPGPVEIGSVTGTPPAAAVTAGGKLLGYAFSTRAVAGSVGFSGRPLDIDVGLTAAGVIAGTRLVAHEEPILIIGISSEELEAFVAGFNGLDIKKRAALADRKETPAGQPDHVTGATISSTVMRDAILRSARAVAASRGITGPPPGKARLNMEIANPSDWAKLEGQGAIARRTISREAAAEALGVPEAEPKSLFIDLVTVLVTPPGIGQNLLGRRAYERLTGKLGAQDQAILVAANGLYSFRGSAWRRSGIFDRVQLIQGTRTITLRAQDHTLITELAAPGSPEFREVSVFRIPADTGFDPVAPWRIELTVTRETESGTTRIASFPLPYRLPAAFVVPASGAQTEAGTTAGEPELWIRIWQDRLPELVGLVLMLGTLTVILFAQDWLARRRTLYRRVRMTFLTLTFLFIGLYSGAQLSVVNVVTFTHTLLEGFRWDLFLLDPLVFTLWCFVALALLFWGRGVFCGWLCPFGALQELLNEAARKFGVKQIEIPWGLHERLWPIKYVLFLAILGLSLQSITWAYQVAEVEPFKTAIILKFFREWPFVLYVLALLVAGLFVERVFCRYLCPLGAALAIPARLRLFEWLKRRQQCGRECRICNTTCTVQAINPLGQINPNECIYCLQCQANYHDATTCLPLKQRAQRRAGATVQKPEGGDNAG